MKTILVLGYGRSASFLVQKLIENRINWNVKIKVVDSKFQEKPSIANENVEFIAANLQNPENRRNFIQEADLCISLLPTEMHYEIALDSIEFKKNLLTASYNSPSIQNLHHAAVEKKIFIGMELGLDPGIDHLTALYTIQELKKNNAKLIAFESYCGGLAAVEYENNPLKYKITWNPKNLIQAGGYTHATFKFEGKCYNIPYIKLFENPMRIDLGNEDLVFEMYPNRNSLSYISLYQLNDMQTFIRGTLRRPPFCKCWDTFVKNGWTNNQITFTNSKKNLTWKDVFLSFIQPWKTFNSNDPVINECIEYLDIFSNEIVPMEHFTVAEALEYLMVKKLSLSKGEKDRVVMIHRIKYEIDNSMYTDTYLLDEKGDFAQTAMTKWVGMPILALVDLWLNQKLNHIRGVFCAYTTEIVNLLTPKLFAMGLKIAKV